MLLPHLRQCLCITAFGDKVKSCGLRPCGAVEPTATWPSSAPLPDTQPGEEGPSDRGRLDAELQRAGLTLGGVNCSEGLVHKNIKHGP